MNRKKKLSRDAKFKLDHGTSLMAETLRSGSTPMIVIGSKEIDRKTSHLEYSIATKLNKTELLYILSRVKGLIDGSIARNN